MRFAVLAALGCLLAAGRGGAAEITASADREYDRHDRILKVTVLPDEDRDMVLRVFETGGGDPAINGNRILLNIKPADQMELSSRTWETGINMNTVDKVSLEDMSVLIRGTEEHLEESGKVGKVPASFRITYQVRDGKLGDKIRVERESGRPDADATPEPEGGVDPAAPVAGGWTEFKCRSYSIRYPSTFRVVPMTAADHGAAFVSPDGSVTFQAFVSPASVTPTDMEVDTEGNAEKQVGAKVTRGTGRTVREVDIVSRDGRYSRSFVDTVTGDRRTVFGITYRDDKALQKNRPLYLKFKESLKPAE